MNTSTDAAMARRTPVWARALVLALVLLLGGYLAHNLLGGRAEASRMSMPQSSAMEDRFGVRFSRVAVVGDGGLVTLSYVVHDAEKATRFQSDLAHPPTLVSEARNGSTHRVSVMKQGHTLRAGQTYYLVFENTAGALHPDELVTIEKAGLRLRHVPVL